MKTYYNASTSRQASTEQQPLLTSVVAMRFGVALIGFACMVIGILLAIKLFFLVAGALSGPSTLPATFENWAKALGQIQARLQSNVDPQPMGRVLTVAIMGAGALFLAHLSMTILTTGARMIHRAGDDLMKIRAELTGQAAPEPDTQAEPPTSFDKSTLD
ncbi:hypothetical protein LLG95_18940 [bacterium]|nr:hypothetical protein [bacterium]